MKHLLWLLWDSDLRVTQRSNLAADPNEGTDLGQSNPHQKRRMEILFSQWQDEVKPAR